MAEAEQVTPIRSGPDASEARKRQNALKWCVFATGFSGIVAEYAMSTLASYLLGDSVIQWTLTISFMLFAMGLGSRLSRGIEGRLLEAFITAELALSLLTAVSAVSVYLLAGYLSQIQYFVYAVSIGIGLLIGLEMPLATRVNEAYEELRFNIGGILEKDYYGALLGGLLFAFVALPYLGLTYTPILLGAVNLGAAYLLFRRFGAELELRRTFAWCFGLMPLALALLAYYAQPIIFHSEQQRYRDKVIYQEQSRYQRIVMTQWRDHHWLYLNGNQQYSSYDEERYHEPLVHPGMALAAARKRVLILGGGDGLAIRELLKYPELERVDLVDIDPAVTRLALEHPLMSTLNGGSLKDPRVETHHLDAYLFLLETSAYYDLILVDLPDPKTVDLARLYSVEFFQSARRHLGPGGVIVTQATSPLFSPDAFVCILKSLREAGFLVAPYHNNIPTMGDWGFVLGYLAPTTGGEWNEANLKAQLERLPILVPTRHLGPENLRALFAFGKESFQNADQIQPNREADLVLQRYYKNGSWDIY